MNGLRCTIARTTDTHRRIDAEADIERWDAGRGRDRWARQPLPALRLGATLLLATLMVFGSAPARASDDGGPLQTQLGLLARTALPMERFGGVEAHLSATVSGFGMAFGLGMERFERANDRLAQGAYALWGLQYRLLESLDIPAYRWVDLHALAGTRLGLFGAGDGAAFHGSVLFGGGLDVRVLPSFRHAALIAHYRFEAFRRPDDAPRHLLLLGIAFRAVPPDG